MGYPTVLDAMPRILHRFPDACLTVAGDGPWRRHYERRARALGRSVEFLGRVSKTARCTMATRICICARPTALRSA